MGYFININKLYGKKEGDTSLSKAKEVYQGKTKIFRICKGLTVVYDEWITTFAASNFTMPSKGGNVEDYINVRSYGTDYDGVKHNMSYKLSIETVPVNTSSTSKNIGITITQLDTGEKINVTCYQTGNVPTTTYGKPVITGLTYNDVNADGTGGNITIAYRQEKITTNSNGTTTTTVTVTGATTPTSVEVSSLITGFGYNTAKGLYGPNCGTSSTSRRKLGTISSISFSANGVSNTVNRTDEVYQKANTSTAETDCKVNISVSPTTIGVYGGSVTVTATSEKTTIRTYSSGEVKTETTNPDITINTLGATFTGTNSVSTIISSGSSVTAIIGQNGGTSERTITFTASVDSYTASASVVQKASYEFYLANALNTDLSAEGGNSLIMVVSKKNGELLDLNVLNVSFSVPWIATKSVQYATSAYYIDVSVKANTSSVARSGKVTITQPESGKTITVVITQAGA